MNTTRHVPFAVKVACYFGGTLNLVGWIFLTFGMLPVWLALGNPEFGIMALFICSIFLAVGAGMVASQIPNATKSLQLIRSGKVSQGKLLSKKPTNLSINDERVYELTFAFDADDGRTYEVSSRTHETHRLQDSHQEYVLYDPFDPTIAQMMDNLPGKPEFPSLDQVRPPKRFLLLLIVPTLFVVINCWGILHALGANK